MADGDRGRGVGSIDERIQALQEQEAELRRGMLRAKSAGGGVFIFFLLGLLFAVLLIFFGMKWRTEYHFERLAVCKAVASTAADLGQCLPRAEY